MRLQRYANFSLCYIANRLDFLKAFLYSAECIHSSISKDYPWFFSLLLSHSQNGNMRELWSHWPRRLFITTLFQVNHTLLGKLGRLSASKARVKRLDRDYGRARLVNIWLFLPLSSLCQSRKKREYLYTGYCVIVVHWPFTENIGLT